jgi:hypothetical protein
VQCWLIKNGYLNVAMFAAEREMASLFDVKADTDNLNTDRFDGRNCHVYLAGWMRRVGNFAAIGNDRTVSLKGTPHRLSVLDVNLVIGSGEVLQQLYRVDPRSLILPPRFQRPQAR